MKIFGYEITKKRDDEAAFLAHRKALGEFTTAYNSAFGGLGGTGAIGDQDFTAMVDRYAGWVYTCANLNATRLAAVPMGLYVKHVKKDQKCVWKTKDISTDVQEYLYKKNSDLSDALRIEEVVNHPLLDLFRNVNNFRNRFDLWEETQLMLELTGNAYWLLVGGRNKKQPFEIWVLPSQEMEIVPSEKDFIAGYIWHKGNKKITFTESEIIHFRFPNPRNRYYGMSPVSAISQSVDYQTFVRIFENSLLRRRGVPEAVLETDTNINDPEFDRLDEEFKKSYGGFTKAGGTMILERGLKYKPITMTPKDMGYIQGLKLTREDIAGGYGIPISMLTSENVNKANAQAGQEQHAKNATEPRCIRMEEKLNEKLTIRYDSNLFLSFDSPVPQDNEFRLKEKQENIKSWYSSINLERAKDKLPPVPWGDKLILQAGALMVDSANPVNPEPTAPKPVAPKPVAPKPTAPKPVEPVPAKEVTAFTEKLLERVKNKLASSDE